MSVFSPIIFDNVSDGDLTIKMSGVPYSTNLREVVKVNDMINHDIKQKIKFLKKMGYVVEYNPYGEYHVVIFNSEFYLMQVTVFKDDWEKKNVIETIVFSFNNTLRRDIENGNLITKEGF